MHDFPGILITFPLLVVLVFGLYHALARFLIYYYVGTDALWILLLGVPVVRIKLVSIVSVEILTLWPATLFAWRHPFSLLRAGNRLGRAVIIHRRRRWMLPYVAITPYDPEGFVAALKQRRALLLAQQAVGGERA